MSFEGYYQVLCKNGHQYTLELNRNEPEESNCPHCKEETSWYNLIDWTNGSFDEDGTRIDGYVELEIKEEAKFCQCDKCGNRHIIKPETYKLPKGVGHELCLPEV